MANEHVSQPVPNLVVGRIRDPQFRDVYSNSSLVALSPFDITLIFSKNTDFSGQQMQVDQVAVAMSPQHFKALVKSLTETLTAYERAFGSLTIPDADISPIFDANQLEEKIQEGRAKTQEMRAMASSTAKKPPAKQSRGAPKP